MFKIIKKAKYYIVLIAFSFLIITFNIMKVFSINDIRFNLALSDLIIPFIGVIIFIRLIKGTSIKNTLKSISIFVGLILWLILTNYLGYLDGDISSVSLRGAIGEWTKTGICILYFFSGYHILKIMNLNMFLKLYSLGYLIFLVVGFLILYSLNSGYEIAIISEYIQANKVSYFLGTYHDPNHAATYIMTSTIILLYGIEIENKAIWKFTYVLVIFCSLPAVLMTDSRGGLISFGIAVSIYIYITYVKSFKQFLIIFLSVILLVVLSLWFESYLFQGYYIRKLIIGFQNFSQGLETRFSLMKVALMISKEHLLFGVGRGNFILNVESYFNSLGVDTIKSIPHNTFLGLIAETGVIGMLLYFSPLILIIKVLTKLVREDSKWLASHWKILNVFLAIISGLVIQASILNIENRRTYWLLAGIILFGLTENKFPIDLAKDNIEKFELRWYRMIIVGIITLVLILFISDKVYIESEYLFDEQISEIVLPIPDEMVDETIELSYILFVDLNDSVDDVVCVEVIERFANGEEVLLFNYDYHNTNGQAVISFVKTRNNSSIIYKNYIKGNELTSYKLTLNHMVCKEKILYLNREYYLVRKNILDDYEFYISKWEALNSSDLQIEYYNQMQFDLENLAFDNKVQLSKINYYNENAVTYLELYYTCLEELEIDYRTQFYAKANNLHDLEDDQFSSNTVHFSQSEKIYTSDWEVGETYKLSYVFNKVIGIYEMYTRFYYINEENETVWLQLESGDTDLYLGWYDLEKPGSVRFLIE